MKKNHNNQKAAKLAKKRHAKNLARKDKTYNPNNQTAMRLAFAKALQKNEQKEQKQNAVAGETLIIS